MMAVWTIARREVFSFFVSPVAYVVLTVWLLMQGLSLFLLAWDFARGDYATGSVTATPLTSFFGSSILLYMSLLVVVPLLTMRLMAAERASGTVEPLLTAPVTGAQVVLGKYVAALAMWAALWVPTTLYIWILSQYGSVDMGVVASSYLGVMGLGVVMMGLGLLASVVAESQIVAAMLAFFGVGGLFLVGILHFFLTGTWREVLSYVSMWAHMADFAKGVVDSRWIFFDVSVAAIAVLLSIAVEEGRRQSR